jgi:hypothetical protein
MESLHDFWVRLPQNIYSSRSGRCWMIAGGMTYLLCNRSHLWPRTDNTAPPLQELNRNYIRPVPEAAVAWFSAIRRLHDL